MKLHKNSGFWLCYSMNLLLNLEWTVPAWILLVLHVVFDWPLWLFVAALLIWAAVLFGITAFMAYVSSCSSTIDRPKPNKNPYSANDSSGAERK